ncbi:hypothetical protein ACO1O0_007011 [Amphichorda felina]
MSSPELEPFDCLIIGGGPAGLGVASSLARMNHSALLFDSGVYRSAVAQHMHNVLGWDHVDASELRARARADLKSRYGSIKLLDRQVSTARRLPSNNFEVVDADGQVSTGRTLVLATGVRDIMPEIEGYAACWGRGIFHCLLCHGYEERDAQSVGVLAVGTSAIPRVAGQTARSAAQFGRSITIYTHGNEVLVTEMQDALGGGSKRIVYEPRRIARIKMAEPGEKGVVIVLEDGTEIMEGFLAHTPDQEINGPFAEQLGLETMESGHVKTTEPFGETSVPGVFAAGDIMSRTQFVTGAALSGGTTGAGIGYMLQAANL